jgi:hypothetical protein
LEKRKDDPPNAARRRANNEGRLRAVVTAVLALIGWLRELATRHGLPVWEVSPLKRRSIARSGVVHIGVREMGFTTGS